MNWGGGGEEFLGFRHIYSGRSEEEEQEEE